MSSEPKPVPADHWMVSDAGQQQGPFTLDQLQQMIGDGRLSAQALVWTPGMSEWKLWSQMPQFAPPAAEPLEMPRVWPSVAAASWKGNWQDFLFFRRMLTPLIIQAVFWLGLAINGIVFLILLFSAFFGGGFVSFVLGTLSAFIWLVLSTLAVRIWCELLILAFRIHDTLAEIRDRLPQ